ncbi:MAG: M20/M25/M40 family metallo-hydrolase [Chloroflexi bacterium]|nr:M20/M25/M40 family metallo-hydrolase [Chloroflexota bacterium]
MNAERTLERAIAIQQIAAPTFEERRRAEYVAQEFKKLGLSDVEMDEIGNVFARRHGADRSRPILVTAHTDTVFPAQTDLTVTRTHERICGPGIGDNSLAVAALFELVQILDEAKIETDGDLWLAANVCEEGLGDLRGMRKVVERFGDSVKATIIIEGMSFGRVIHGAIGVHRFRITAQAEGGHSWSKFGNPSAIHGLIKLANHIVEMDVPKKPKTTYNIGVIRGGTSVNTIANEASLELDPLIQLAADSLRAVGEEPKFEVGSTDANIPLSKGLAAVVVGICEGHNAHRPDEYIETARAADGMRQLVLLVTGAFRVGD